MQATHGLDFEGSKAFKWNGNRRHKYIQSKKEKETLSLEITRRSIIHAEPASMPVFAAQASLASLHACVGSEAREIHVFLVSLASLALSLSLPLPLPLLLASDAVVEVAKKLACAHHGIPVGVDALP